MSQKMNLVHKLYQEFALDAINKTSWVSGNEAPTVVELDPTAACDLACPGCISEDLVALANRFPNDRLLSLGQEIVDSGIKAVVLIGGGEPLAHPKIGQLITLLGSQDVHIGITTNGTFIDRYIDQIAEYSQWTRVSMDAASNAVFSVLRPTKGKGAKSKFDKIIANMRMLGEQKKGKMGYSYLIQTEADGPGVVSNVHEIYDAAVLARDVGCDYFQVKPTYQFREDVEHALMKHNNELMQRAKEEIARLDSLETKNFKILKAINLQYSLDGVNVAQEKSYKTCPSTHLRTTVTPTGVYVCPYWRGKDHMSIGDVNETNFSDMWKGGRRQKIMQTLDVSKSCQFHCLRHETNLTCFDIKEKQESETSIEAVPEYDRFL